MPAFGLAASDSWLERWFVLLDTLPGVKWVETGFLTRDQLPHLARRLRETEVSWGFHFPLIKEASWPGLVEQGHSPAKRRHLRRMVRESFYLGREMGASYANLHMPFYMRGVPDTDFGALVADETAFWAEAAHATGLAVHLENARLRPGFFETAADFTDLCRRHQGFQLCLDLGHLFGQVVEGRFQGDQVPEFIRAAAPCVAAAHVYQFRVEDMALHEGRTEVIRCPVLPDLDPRDGWADLPRLLLPVAVARPDCLLILEHGYGQGVTALRAEVKWLAAALGVRGGHRAAGS